MAATANQHKQTQRWLQLRFTDKEINFDVVAAESQPQLKHYKFML